MFEQCGCNCHNRTDGNPNGCNLCLLMHPNFQTPQMWPQPQVNLTIDYQPAILAELQKLNKMLEGIFKKKKKKIFEPKKDEKK